jgi:DNA polymerase-4
LDLNSYFASVEQAESPELRGRPVGVAATPGDSATIIAASYEAKAFGVKTGTKVGDARRMCSDIVICPARPQVYVAYHKRILSVLENVLPIDKVCSIDEMRFRLLGDETLPERAKETAYVMKRLLKTEVGENLTCNIGIAPNAFLAKLATEFHKPDGLTVLTKEDLPERLMGLPLTTYPGINVKMEARLVAAGITNSRALVTATLPELRRAFGGIIGERWWYMLKGYDVDSQSEGGKSLGHSHVLAPEFRTDEGCREVMLRLIAKACARLRANHYWAEKVSFSVKGMKRSWATEVSLPPTQDTITITDHFLKAWEKRSFSAPLKASVTFTHLKPDAGVTPSLFEDTKPQEELSRALDHVNQKYGKNSIFLAGLSRAKDTASEKIAFNKTWLFSEGKGDHEEVNSRTGKPFFPLED